MPSTIRQPTPPPPTARSVAAGEPGLLRAPVLGGTAAGTAGAAAQAEAKQGRRTQDRGDARVPAHEVLTDSETAPAVDPGWEVLSRVAAGEVNAFAALVEAHQERLLRLCERMLGDLEEARDAAQEVFLKAFRKAGDFRPQGQVYTWLYRIATNHCLNRIRRRKVIRFIQWENSEERDAAPFDPPDASPDPAATLEMRRRWQQTRRVITQLPAGQRAVLVLARFEGLSYRQIAEVLGITEGAVESRLFRAMRRIEAAQDWLDSRVS
ncbi:MAG TPA: RNA polymerase sigma factor [Thermoanaerobaculia bacterium]|nr:RNA polymerase sigma factor [Thermoanaerobaculia bacterium]